MASSVIGALRVNLGIDTAAFSNGLKGAGSKLSGFGAMARKALIPLTAAIAAAAAGTGLAIRGAINAADELSKSAQRFGIPIEELGRLKYAADLSDVSLSALGTSAQRLSRNMVEAANGNKTAAAAFSSLGISVKNADGTFRATEDVLHDLADRFAAMPDGASKTAAAMQLMGRGGAQMIPLLNGGSAALREMGNEAQRAGLIISQETGTQAERFNDALTRLRAVAQGLATQLMASLAPAMANIAEGAVRIALNLRNLGAIAREIFARMGDAAVGMGLTMTSVAYSIRADFLSALFDVESRLASVTAAIASAMNMIGGPIGMPRVNPYLVADPDKLENDISSSRLIAEDTAEMARGYFDAAKAPLESLVRPTTAAAGAMDDLGVAMDEAAGSAGGGGGARGLSSALDELKSKAERVFADTRTPAENFSAQMAELNQMVQAGLIDWDTYARAVTQAQDALKDAGEKGESAFQGMNDQFGQMVSNVIQGTSSIKDAFASMLSQIGGSLVSSSVSSGLSAVFGGIKIPGFANGTRFAPGGLAWVGERGPELMNVPRGAQIIPNHDIGGIGGRIEVALSPDLEARILDASAAQSITIVGAEMGGLKAGFGQSVHRAVTDPRMRRAR